MQSERMAWENARAATSTCSPTGNGGPTSQPSWTSGRYSSEQLLQLAEAADAGFDRAMFAETLGALVQISDAAFAPYGADTPAIQRLRQRFADWRKKLSQQ